MAREDEGFRFHSQQSQVVLDSWSAIMLAIPGKCFAAKVILQVRHHPKFLLPNCTPAWSEHPLLIDVSHCWKYCLTWLGQCNDPDLLHMFWELGTLLVVPDNLCGVLSPQLTIIPYSILTIHVPPLSWKYLTLSIFSSLGERWSSPGTSLADTAYHMRSALASWDKSRCTLNFSVTAEWEEFADGTEFINLCKAL